MRGRPVGDRTDLRAARDEVAGRGLARLSGPQQEHSLAAQLPEHLLGERGGGGRDGRGALADRRLDAHAPARVQGLAEEPVEKRPRRAGLEGGPHLTEDLALAGDERVQAAGDAEEVERRRLVAEAVQRRPQLVGTVTGQVEQRLHAELLGALVAHEVELGAIARREHDRLRAQLAGERGRGARVERDTLAQLDRRIVVRDADEGEVHEAKWVSGRTTATRAKPPRLSRAALWPRQPSCRSTSNAT